MPALGIIHEAVLNPRRAGRFPVGRGASFTGLGVRPPMAASTKL